MSSDVGQETLIEPLPAGQDGFDPEPVADSASVLSVDVPFSDDMDLEVELLEELNSVDLSPAELDELVVEAEPLPASPSELAPMHTLSPEPTPTEPNLIAVDEDPGEFGSQQDISPPPRTTSGLEALYRSNAEWSPLARVLLERAEAVTEPSKRAGLLREVAAMYRDQLGNVVAARTVLLTAFDTDPASAETAEALEAIASETGQWIETIEAYRGQAVYQAQTAPALAGELWLRVACIHLVVTHDARAAQSALDQVHEVDLGRAARLFDVLDQAATTSVAVEYLAGVAHRVGDLSRSGALLNRAVSLEPSGSRRSHLHLLIGRLELDQGNDQGAEWHLSESIRLEPASTESRACLADLFKARGEHRRAAELLDAGRAVIDDPSARAQVACQAAAIYADDLGEKTSAFDLFSLALTHDPGNVGAAAPLAERYYTEKRWHDLEPIIDMLAARCDLLGDDSASKAQLLCRAGETATHLSKRDKARDYFHSALGYEPTSLDALLGAAQADLHLGDVDAAVELFDRALTVQRSRHVPHAELAETLFGSAQAREKRGERAEARSLYQSILKGGFHAGAAEALCESHLAESDVDAAIELKLQTIADHDDKGRVRVLTEAADLAATRQGNASRAVDLLNRALEHGPNNCHVLHKLVDLHSEARRWGEAVQAILRMANIETDPLRKGKYFHAAGSIARRELNLDSAVEYFNSALDCYFGGASETAAGPERERMMSAFRSMVSSLGEAGDWKQVERNYRQMIKRLGNGDPALAQLWTELGNVYRNHLGQRYAAINSFEVASALDGGRLTHDRVLIDLYEHARRRPYRQGDRAALPTAEGRAIQP